MVVLRLKTRSLHEVSSAKERLSLTCLHSYHIKKYVNKQYLSIKMLLSFYFPFLVAKWPSSLGVIYFLIITCSVNGCYIPPPSDVEMLLTDNKENLWKLAKPCVVLKTA